MRSQVSSRELPAEPAFDLTVVVAVLLQQPQTTFDDHCFLTVQSVLRHPQGNSTGLGFSHVDLCDTIHLTEDFTNAQACYFVPRSSSRQANMQRKFCVR